MPIHRPALLKLGGEERYADYESEFDRLLRRSPVQDALGRLVEFPPHACQHVCFKPQNADRYGRAARDVWDPHRAERIPWILPVIQSPDDVRPSQQGPDRECWLALVRPSGLEDAVDERFVVCLQAVSSTEATFLTAFPIERAYWDAVRRGGPAIYPAQDRRSKKRRK